MPNMYMGRGGLDGLFGGGGGSVGPVGVHPVTQGDGKGFSPKLPPVWGGPINRGPQTGSGGNMPGIAPPQGSVLDANAVRASGPSQGYDPSYLQNLATSIGGLFARPQGNMSFNPLGNLNEISPPSGQMGNAPGFGEPLTWLQQALNGLGFSWKPPQPTSIGSSGGGGGGTGDNGGDGRPRGGRPIF